jgi:hypothetical protein
MEIQCPIFDYRVSSRDRVHTVILVLRYLNMIATHS